MMSTALACFVSSLVVFCTLLEHVQCVGNPNDPQLMVECYSAGLCDLDGDILFDGDKVTALDCCTIHGHSLRTPSMGEAGGTCHVCITVGFKQTSVSISGVNTSHAITVESSLYDPSFSYTVGLELKVTAMDPERPFDQILDMQKYDVPESFQLTTAEPERDIVLRIGNFENSVALEEDAQYMLELSVPLEVRFAAVHFVNKIVNVTVGDPDTASIKFEQEDYTFSENVGNAVVRLVRSGAIARTITIRVTSDNFFQSAESVIRPSSLMMEFVEIFFPIPNNNVGLQNNATATLVIESVSSDMVIIGEPSMAKVTITDDDFVVVGFDQSEFSFNESVGTGSVSVALSRNIAKSIQLKVTGGPMIQPLTVQISGTDVDEIIQFTPDGPRSVAVNFQVNDDNVALETVEAYILALALITEEEVIVGQPQTAGLYHSTRITIIDDDNVQVEMARQSQTVAEGDDSVRVCAVLSNPSALTIHLTFDTNQIDATDPDDYIGGSRLVTSSPNSTDICVMYAIQEDNLVEGVENFEVSIDNLLPAEMDGLSLGQQTTTQVMIIDANEEVKEPVCNREIDIMFLLDSSGSIQLENYTAMLTFATEVAKGFEFGTEGAQFGVVTFASMATLDIHLGEHADAVSFSRALMDIPYKATRTNTAMGLELATQEIEDRGREDVPHAFIVLTDGRSNDPQATRTQAALAQGQGIKILSVGIGSEIDMNELNDISSDPNEDNVFLISDFSESSFSSLLAPLVRETCEVNVGFTQSEYEVKEGDGFLYVSFGVLSGTLNRNITVDFSFSSGTAKENQDFSGLRQSIVLSPDMQNITIRLTILEDFLPEPEEFFTAIIDTSDEFIKVTVPTARIVISDDDDKTCSGNLDLVAVLDLSPTVSQEEFDRSKQFIYEFASEFVTTARFGVVSYSSGSTEGVQIQLGEIGSISAFKQAVSRISLQPGVSNAAEAVRMATDELIARGTTDIKTMLLITDGRFSDSQATIQAAARARSLDINVVVVGIGASAAAVDDLNAIATNPDSRYVSLLSNFSDESFNGVRKSLAQVVCVPKCERAIDLVFVIESSSSIGSSNFDVIKNYLSDVVGLYTIGPSNVLVGVIRYSTDASTVVTLGADSDLISLQLSIESILYVPGSVNTAAAINHAVQELNTNGRDGVPKVLVVVTATQSDDTVATAAAAGGAQSQGIELFALGIGGAVNQQELRNIVTDPDSDHLFQVGDFTSGSLGAATNSVVRGTCAVLACRTPPLDLVFALDSSGSVGPDQFTDLLNFVVDVIQHYNIGSDSTRVSIVRYSSVGQLIVSLNQFTTKEMLVAAVLNTAFVGGSTNTASAIEIARNELISNGRSFAKRILVIATDGQSNSLVATTSQANSAKSEGIEIFSIGIGSGVNIDELNSIASTPVSTHVLTITDYTSEAFASVIGELNQGICTESLTCSREAEVVFVVDASVDESTFTSAKQLIIGILSEVDVSQMATRVSVVQFSTSAQLAIRLTDINNHQELSSRLAPLTAISGSRNLAVAIQLAVQEIQTIGRVGVTRIMYIILFGASDNLEATINAAQSINNNDITLIGIGNSAAGSDLQQFVFPDFLFITNNLNSPVIRQNSVDAICTQVPKCHLDLLFVLESSSSISSSNFQELLKLIVRTVDQFEIGATATQVGVISFSSTSSTSSPVGFSLGTFSEKEQLKQAILSLQQLAQSGRRTDLALRLARQQLISFRSDVPNAVIVVTSGLSDDPQETALASDLLQSVIDTEVFVIGASAVVDTTSDFLEELFKIGQDPDSDHVFMIHGTFQEQSIESISQQLINELCDDDSNVMADPVFSVPIAGPRQHDSELCYEIYGTAEKHFNLVSDKCLAVNAHYSNSQMTSRSGRSMHFINQISIMAVNDIQHCVTVVVEIEQNQCIVTANGAVLNFNDNTEFEAAGVKVTLSLSNRVLVSVPNCGQENVLMIVSCRMVRLNSGFVEFQIQDGLGIRPSAHGLIGQFWNVPISVTNNVNVTMRGAVNKDDLKVLGINHPDSLLRQVPAWRGPLWFGVGHTSCLYAGDTQGGHVYEVESPNDSLIEGTYKEYIVSSIFAIDFKFNKFQYGNCK